MRKSGDPNFKIDWSKFDGNSNQCEEEAAYAKKAGKFEELKNDVSTFW